MLATVDRYMGVDPTCRDTKPTACAILGHDGSLVSLSLQGTEVSRGRGERSLGDVSCRLEKSPPCYRRAEQALRAQERVEYLRRLDRSPLYEGVDGGRTQSGTRSGRSL